MKQKTPLSKTKIIVISIFVVIATILISLVLYKWLQPKPTEITHDFFIKKVKEAAADSGDSKYIKQIIFNTDTQSALLRYHIDGKTFYYKVGIPSRVISEWFNEEHPYYQYITDALKFVNSKGVESSGWMNSVIPQQQSVFMKWFTLLLPTIIFGIIIFLVYKAQMNMYNGTGAIGEKSNPAVKVKSDKTFKNVAGNSEAIEEIKEIVDYLKNPKKYEIAGARMPKGILLGGPPGTGKTLLAKATAGEANVPFYFISASNFVEMYVGLGAKRVRSVVKEARKNAPAIIFIDELDAIGRTRGSGIGGGNDEREQTLNQLLVEMDGMTENNGLLFFAATNRTDILDPALTRPGRFDRTITVSLPDVKEREAILRLHAKGKRISKDVDLAQLAKRTPGYSGSQLENVINEASLLAVRENSNVILRSHIDEAVDRVVSGPAKKNRVISKEELTMVAYHEAGHAVVGIKLKGANKVQKITIIPRGNAGGYNLMTPEEEKYNASKSELVAVITSFLGGRASEQIIYGQGEVSTGAADDIAKATKIARRMVAEWGMSSLGPIQYEEDTTNPFLGRDFAKSTHSNQVGHEIDLEVRKIILDAEAKAIEIISANRDLLELIKDALLEKETIVAEEIEYIEKNMKLPPKEEKVSLETTENSILLDDLLQEIDDVDAKKEEVISETSINSNEFNAIDLDQEIKKQTIEISNNEEEIQEKEAKLETTETAKTEDSKEEPMQVKAEESKNPKATKPKKDVESKTKSKPKKTSSKPKKNE